MERDGVLQASLSSSSCQLPTQESGAEPPAQKDKGQLPVLICCGQLTGEKSNGQPPKVKANRQPSAQRDSIKAPSPEDMQSADITGLKQTGSRVPSEVEDKDIPNLNYSPVFGSQASHSNRNQKKEEEKNQPQVISSGTEGGQLQDSDHDPLWESRPCKRESHESHSGRSAPEQKLPRVQTAASGNVQASEVTLYLLKWGGSEGIGALSNTHPII